MEIGETLQVMKQDVYGNDLWGYPGKVICHNRTGLLLEAFFNRPDLPFHGIVLREGDRFLEVYSLIHWYNIFEVYDKNSQEIKCWYCNVATPCRLEDGKLSYRDLALDYLAFPDGKGLVLDEDEFEKLDISSEMKTKSLAALEELKNLFGQPEGFNVESYFS